MIDPNRNEKRRYGIQGQLSFDPANANVTLYNQIKKFMESENGLGGSGGTLANRFETARSFSQSNVFNTSTMRRDAEERLNKQLQEHLERTVGEQAKAQGMGIQQFLGSQGISGASYRRDNFIESSQNPITGSSEKMARAYMGQIGAKSRVMGGTNENRRLVSFLRPEEAAHVNGYIDTASQQINTGTYNKSDFEGLYGSTEQRILAKSKRNEFRNNIAIGNIDAAPPAVMEEYKSKILKQNKEKKLMTQARKELEDSGEIEPVEQKKEKKGKSTTQKAMEQANLAIGKIFSVLGDLKSLFASAVSFLQNIAAGIGGLKQTSAALGIPIAQVMQLQNMGRLNAVSGGTANTFTDAAQEWLDLTSDPSKVEAIKWDSAVLHGHAKLIKPIITEAVKMKLKPVDLMYNINNALAAEYFNPDLNDEQRARLRMRQMLVLKSLPGSASANAYQVATDAATMYGLGTGKNRYRVMQAVQNNSNNYESRATIFEAAGLTKQSSVGSMENQRKLNDFDRFIKALEDMTKQFTMVHLDDITRAMSELALALLKFLAWFDKDGTAAKLAEVLERRMKFTATDDRKELTYNMTVVDRALRQQLKAMGYTGTAAEGIINEGINAKTPEEIMQRLKGREGSTKTFTEAEIRKAFILSVKNRKMHRALLDFDEADPEDRTSLDSYNLENEGQNNSDENIIIYNYLKNKDAVQPLEFEGLLKGVGKLKDRDLIQKSKAKLTDEQLRKRATERYKKGHSLNTLPQFNLDPYTQFMAPNRSLASAGFMSSGAGQVGQQPVTVYSEINLKLNDKPILVTKDSLSDKVKKTAYYTANIG